MNVEELVRASLREQAAGTATAPADLAGRVLTARRRRRARHLAGAAVTTVLVVTAALAGPGVLNSGEASTQLASEASRGKTLTHVDQSPPRDLIAVGDQALAAYFTSRQVKQPNRDQIMTRTYSVLDQKTGRYEVDARWAYLTVAPGMRTAAVLERQLPVTRIGVLDLLTKKVTRWIPMKGLDGGVGAVQFSPDGKKLIATTYDKDPFRTYWSKRIPVNNTEEPQPVACRTGFAIVDVETGESDWHALPAFTDPEYGRSFGSGEWLRFNNDGTLVYEFINMAPGRIFRDLRGKEVPAPPKEKHVNLVMAPAGLSPNGELVAGPFAGGARTTATEVLDPATGKRAAKLKGQELLVWADDKRLIAWDIAPGGKEFDNRLVLITIGSDKVVSLSGARTPQDNSPGRWEPIFARR
ncbi:hypothetical protein GCM10011583_30950 [Streptomyces camponoticapitis]|uniref:WD40 repeat domain-containing protein n=1 Tax=Streptomyces camponoticapitis TaxID=1616125 RepID=A0ABQ2E747_9ACTN|nr:hypothetical protein [Streptomyces camponoticapitis]GGJ97188.1 hypothetical protein GCM10011583_30950 [Streptomyces camponoticapitis]